jgi:two-component system, response regulator
MTSRSSAIRSDLRMRHVPAVILTSSQNERGLPMAYCWRANGYIVKPMEYEQFLRVLSQVGSCWAGTNRLQAPEGPPLPDWNEP